MRLLPPLSITLYQDRTYFLNSSYKINTNRTTTLPISLLLINFSSVWLKCARGQCTEIVSWKPKAAPSLQHLFLGFHCCTRTPPEIQQREALLREFRKVTSALSLPILQDLPLYIGLLRSRKPPLRLASQLVDTEFCVKPAGTIINTRHDYCKFGMIIIRKEWTLLSHFRTQVGRGQMQYKWVFPSHDHLWCGADVQIERTCFN